jgi:hypothetical protein
MTPLQVTAAFFYVAMMAGYFTLQNRCADETTVAVIQTDSAGIFHLYRICRQQKDRTL